jgi:hypothetical protein
MLTSIAASHGCQVGEKHTLPPPRPPTSGRLLLIGATFAGLAALRKTACILGKVCYNGKRSCSGGAETPRSAAQVRYHPGKGV